jgi:hypothetical protein
LGARRDEQAEHRGVLGIEIILYDAIMKDIYHYKFTQTHGIYKPNDVNY